MKYFLIAGEASGDLHASRLMKCLAEQDPEAEFRYLGGDRMARYGGRPLVHCRDMAFMGFVNVLLNLDKINVVRRTAEQAVVDFRPDRVILVDYPGFNLRFAKYVKRHLPDTEVDYYISPKLWAWKSYRIRDIRRYVDRMFTIFPFETEYFARRSYTVHYVGNPSVDAIASFMSHPFDEARFRAAHGLDARPVVAILAGSRMQEIRKCLPVMAAATEQFHDVQFVVAEAPDADHRVYAELLKPYPGIHTVAGATYELLRISRAAMVNSGTATLETALFRVPEVVVYKVVGGRLTMLLKPVLIRTRWVSLVNIIAGREVVRELLAHHFTAATTARELDLLLHDEQYRARMIEGYDSVIQTLGPAGAPARLARMLIERQ